MKKSIKMEDYDGYQFIKIHRTKILPLRWFANLCEIPAHYHLGKYLYYSDHDDYGLACKYHAFLSNILYKPYLKWGTVYDLNLDPVLDRLGSDYDEDGVAYWEKWTDSESLDS